MRHYEEKTLVFIKKRAEAIAAYIEILLGNMIANKTDYNLIKADADAIVTMADALVKAETTDSDAD